MCCTEVARTPVFVPTPNAVTTIATALPVRKDTLPDPINNTVTFDSLALSVLAPNVPVPAFDTGRHDPSDFSIPSAAVYHPAVAAGQERFISSGVGGFQVLMAADVTPSPTGAGPAPQTPLPGGGVTAPIALVRPRARDQQRRGAAADPLRAGGDAVHRHGAAAGRSASRRRLRRRSG